jgi:hypothetical protein
LNLRNLLRPGARHGTREPRNTPNTRKQEETDCGLFLGESRGKLVPFELFRNTGKTFKSSVPVLSAGKPWFPQGFSHIGPIALAFCAYPCMSMPAGAAPGEIIVLCAALDPKSISVSRLVSRQSRARTLVFRYKMIKLKQPITPQNSCSAHECFVLFN